MFRSIWERYFVSEFIKVFLLFLVCFYGLYVLIDYASHTSALPHHHIQLRIRELIRYYLFILASRAEILIPLALLIAFIKTVCTLNTHQELVALMAGGIKLKTLMRPFLMIALAFVGLLYLNEQFVLPSALKKLRHLENATKHQKKRQLPEITVKHVVLEDRSLLLYQNYDSEKEEFFDVYWIESIDSIYRAKYLCPNKEIPVGYFVDHLLRQPNGELLQQQAYSQYEFKSLLFNQELLQSAILDPDILPLTNLFFQQPSLFANLSEKESKIATAFYWKLLMPWLCLLAILAPAPSCVRFSRQIPIFFIYIYSLFGLIAFYMLMDASQVLAKRQVLPPIWAIGLPFILVFSFYSYRFARLK
ncbi:LptF/LptG family permease [Candidatus Protochlamydia amoebophila]|nr:LptF/LptG family permease [Candidatus Protochlamydia amoebophila]